MIGGPLSAAPNYPALSASNMALAVADKACTFLNCFASAQNKPVELAWEQLDVGSYGRGLPVLREPLSLAHFAKSEMPHIDTQARPLMDTGNIVKYPLAYFDNPEADYQVQG